MTRRGAIGSGLTGGDYLNLLFLVMIPKLVPFAASILSACFGLVYFGFEKKLKRPLNVPLALVHLVSYLLAISAHLTLARFWWRVLGEEHATNTPLPLCATPSAPPLQILAPELKHQDEIPGRYGGEIAPQRRPDRHLAREPRVGNRYPRASTPGIAFQKVEGKQPHAQKGDRQG